MHCLRLLGFCATFTLDSQIHSEVIEVELYEKNKSWDMR